MGGWLSKETACVMSHRRVSILEALSKDQSGSLFVELGSAPLKVPVLPWQMAMPLPMPCHPVPAKIIELVMYKGLNLQKMVLKCQCVMSESCRSSISYYFILLPS